MADGPEGQRTACGTALRPSRAGRTHRAGYATRPRLRSAPLREAPALLEQPPSAEAWSEAPVAPASTQEAGRLSPLRKRSRHPSFVLGAGADGPNPRASL